MKGNMLIVKNVSKSFGRHVVLKGVSFQIQRGEIVGIVGENGAGKSTLLKIIMGLLPPNSGSVKIQGGVGYCPQETMVFERLTVRENFQYFATAYGLNRKGGEPSWESRMDVLIKQFHFKKYENMLFSQLSGGTKQKLNLSLSILHSPEIIVLDEPYAAFDWETYLHFWNYALEMRSQGNSIILVSHFVYDRSKIDTLYELKEGRVKCE